jgi:outer membrane protein TolC
LFAGVQLHWKVWTWGAADRDRRVFDLDRQILAADEASFTKALVRSNDDQLATIDRLEQALALDDRIVALREDIERTTGVRFREGVVPAAEYLDRSSELVQARFARATHRVELAQAGARYLTTLGLEVR